MPVATARSGVFALVPIGLRALMRGSTKLGLLIAVVVAPALPLAVGYLHNESVIDDAQGQLHMIVQARGRPLDRAWRVSGSAEGCSAIVAVSFLTERKLSNLGLNLRGPSSSYGLAWAEGGKPTAEWPINTPTSQIERPVQSLLDQWLLFADGKQRFVLYQRSAVPNGFDPRCW